MIRLFIGAKPFLGALAPALSSAQARPAAQLMAGDPSAANVAFAFGVKGSGQGLRIETHQIGNPGAKFVHLG